MVVVNTLWNTTVGQVLIRQALHVAGVDAEVCLV